MPARKSAAPAAKPSASKKKPQASAAAEQPKKAAVPATAKPAEAAPARRTTKKSAPQKAVTQAAAKPAAKPAAKAAAKPVAKPAAKPASKPATKAKAKGKGKKEREEDDTDLSDIEADLEGELEAEAPVADVAAPAEKPKPLRMKISKAKERALMKEFGLDETILSEEDMAKRRAQLKKLITLGKTRGYLTQGEISDHLPDKLVDHETLEAVVALLSDMGVAVYEQTPDAETLFQNNVTPTATTVEEAEEEAEAALSTVDSEFGRTTDPVRMYMREMGTVELLTREGEIEIAKRIEGGLMD
ncbi:MAG: RNA polymerase sigma factor RpoD, partial [Comamonadaceae bacterium]|nr:RNA polymerase sigma factor RpoD [Comamonadaceae bacterium]